MGLLYSWAALILSIFKFESTPPLFEHRFNKDCVQNPSHLIFIHYNTVLAFFGIQMISSSINNIIITPWIVIQEDSNAMLILSF